MAKEINLPVIVTVRYDKFEELFKYLVKKIIMSDDFKASDCIDINKILTKKVVIGLEKVDFNNNKNNKLELNILLDELWKKFEHEFKLKIMFHKRKLEKGR
jgi:hypothetical protein